MINKQLIRNNSFSEEYINNLINKIQNFNIELLYIYSDSVYIYSINKIDKLDNFVDLGFSTVITDDEELNFNYNTQEYYCYVILSKNTYIHCENDLIVDQIIFENDILTNENCSINIIKYQNYKLENIYNIYINALYKENIQNILKQKIILIKDNHNNEYKDNITIKNNYIELIK